MRQPMDVRSQSFADDDVMLDEVKSSMGVIMTLGRDERGGDEGLGCTNTITKVGDCKRSALVSS